jgi:hypothetical protein
MRFFRRREIVSEELDRAQRDRGEAQPQDGGIFSVGDSRHQSHWQPQVRQAGKVGQRQPATPKPCERPTR